MKPGKATIDTITTNILEYETSPAADKLRGWTRDLQLHLRAIATGAVSVSSMAMCADAYATITRLLLSHREFRRMARRLAKMAIVQEAQLRESHAEHDALITRIVKLEAEIDRLDSERVRLEGVVRALTCDSWEDVKLPEQEEIDAAFPTRSGRHDLFQEAMRLVGAKHSKGALVRLVVWLLLKAEAPKGTKFTQTESDWARDFLFRVLGQEPATNDVGELARKLGAVERITYDPATQADKLSDLARQWAERIEEETGELGITVALADPEVGKVGISSNVEPTGLVNAFTKWKEQIVARGKRSVGLA